MTIRNALTWARKELKKNKVEGVAASANFLMRQVLGAPQGFILANPEKKLTLIQERKFVRYVKRRKKHEPVWYITGHIEFYGNDLMVSESVLIPRPETEILIEKILTDIKLGKSSELNILDVGTGSGAIILSLADNLRNSVLNEEFSFQNSLNNNMTKTYKFFASDISKAALKIAKKNAIKLELNKAVKFKNGDLFGPWVGQKFDIVVANLPYVPHEDMSSLAFDLIHYEPRVALDGGEKGLEIYKRFFTELPHFLNTNALVFCEIGDKQGKLIEKMVRKSFNNPKVEVIKDCAGFDRFVIIKT